MSLDELGIIGYQKKTLLIDGDIVIYQPCCTYNGDSDHDRGLIIKAIHRKIEQLMRAADCDEYIMFVTGKLNFRNWITDDYKANRKEIERPINLVWAKRWAVNTLNNHHDPYMEADDLLGIHQTEDTVIWSLDKDLRQIPGQHLDDKTQTVVTINPNGKLRHDKWVTKEGKKKSKVYFDGLIGLYYQMLIGDPTDNILGCGIREEQVYKTGAKAGQTYMKRKGVGSMAALKMLVASKDIDTALKTVCKEYLKIHGDSWQDKLEEQANLLFMTREKEGCMIKRWTVDGRDQWMNKDTGEIHDNWRR